MTRSSLRVATALAFTLALAATARAQPGASACAQAEAPAPTPTGQLAAPIPWTEFRIEGSFVDDPALVHALLAPTVQHYKTNLTAKTLADVAKIAAKFGYDLVGHSTRDIPGGVELVLRVASLPLVRKVDVDIPDQGIFDKLLDEEVRRRMQVRVGSYLPSDPFRRSCALDEERQRIEEYLHDEGYFDAVVKVAEGSGGTKLGVHVELGSKFKVCKLDVVAASSQRLAVTVAEIQKQFQHAPINLIIFKLGATRFTRTQHEEDLQHVRELFHKRGYPTARVQSSFNDPEGARTSFDRRTSCVNVTITVDQRRNVDVRFDGYDHEAITEEQLKAQLTFDQAGSVDDVEAANSARAIANYLQKRGLFDARVTYTRDRLPDTDLLAFHIEQGKGRQVNAVEFVGNVHCGNDDRCKAKNPLYKEFNDGVLAGIIATKKYDVAKDLIGASTTATTEQMTADVDRIREYYRRAGFRDAKVTVSASPGCRTVKGVASDCALGNAALTAALVATGDGDDLYVRFTIDPGERTELVGIEIEPGDADASKQLTGALCGQMLAELARELPDTEAAATLARRTDANRCTGLAHGLPFREDVVATTKDQLRDFMFKRARPRADIDYEVRVVGPHRVEAHYKVRTLEQRRVGKIVVRGAFRTTKDIILGELQLHEGELLTADALADAARRLRATNLFDAVNVDLPDLVNESTAVNLIVRVDEHFWYRAQVEVGAGYSSYNGPFAQLTPTISNLFGRGISLPVTVIYGEKIRDYEAALQLPQYWIRQWLPVEFQAEIKGLYLYQDTPRFGWLTTEGASLALTRIWRRPKNTRRHDAYNFSLSGHYDYRLRTRDVDALRPIGPDLDDTQVAISTATGSIGVTADLDGRVDRNGQLAPLSPSDGYHLGVTASYASPALLGQDTFVKLSATGTLYHAVGDNLVLRADLRYDEGFPLGGAVLLPDVERFFAGGDNTVRGYQDDRLATEIIQTGVPPLGGVSQIRVYPAGGNIRTLGSLDAQYRIWKALAGAMFTDAGMITNTWGTVTVDDIRPSVGAGLRILSPFGIGAFEYAVPIHPHLGDDPRGRIHVYFAARAQF